MADPRFPSFRLGLGSILFVVALLAAACGGGEQNAEESANQAGATEAMETPQAASTEISADIQKLAELAHAIESAPENAAELLQAANMTAEEFEAEIYRIASDPALSKAYEAARSALKR